MFVRLVSAGLAPPRENYQVNSQYAESVIPYGIIIDTFCLQARERNSMY